jgi:hypothetical protein
MSQRGGFGSGAAGFGRRGMEIGGDIGGSRMAISYGGSYGGRVGGHGMGGHNQQYPNQMGWYGGGMMGPGVGFGGTMLLGERIKRILRYVSFFTFCLTPNDSSFQPKPALNTPASTNASQSAPPASSNKKNLVRTHQRPDTPMSKNDAINFFT